MDAKNRRGVGKSDVIDAFRIAAAARPLPVKELRRPRLRDGIRQSVQILVTARESMSKDRTRSVNALNALMRSNNLCLDAREKLNSVQISEVSHWRHREEEISISIVGSSPVSQAHWRTQ